MIETLRQMLRDKPRPAAPSLPPGERVYAIGDVHGRLDLLAALADAVDADDAIRAAARTTVILLGDLVDRGLDSAGVIDFAIGWARRRRVRCIAGNHEEMFLAALEDPGAFRHFLRIGGYATVLSYGVDPGAFRSATLGEAQAMARAAVPDEHVAFLSGFEERIGIGDYLFVHAGIEPGVAIEAQTGENLRWIREPFLSSSSDHGCVVVHGHTISDDAVLRPNRIGIDTGAFMSGRLTALCLEGTQRRLMEAREDAGGTAIAVSPA